LIIDKVDQYFGGGPIRGRFAVRVRTAIDRLRKRKRAVKTDSEFLSALFDSQTAVTSVASYLQRHGAQISVPEIVARPNFAQRFDYQDQGDIQLNQRIEVKQKLIDFTCAADYPYPTIMVDAAYKVDAMPWGHLHSYFVVNKSCTHAAYLHGSTRPQWRTEEVYDRKERERRTYYVAPIDLARFFDIRTPQSPES